jgi:Tfp pilus assembly protein PilN
VVELALVRSAYLSLASLQAYMADSSDDEEWQATTSVSWPIAKYHRLLQQTTAFII